VIHIASTLPIYGATLLIGKEHFASKGSLNTTLLPTSKETLRPSSILDETEMTFLFLVQEEDASGGDSLDLEFLFDAFDTL
jgi:hypothetical protein